MVKKHIESIVKSFIKAVQAKNIKVETAILFGSYAHDRANENSDIDIAVISPDFGKDKFEEAILLKEISEEIDLDISPEPFSLEEFKKASKGDFLYQEIILKGKIIPVY